ncbi:MAG: S-methyl-5-thioribose-1-phosphate isomerase [Dehalococcoidales bacterium]|nr:S-methyl-5-thioribose-1-phosphate isomerase [Dehalococcoidales bacterium]
MEHQITYAPIEWLGDKVRLLDQTRLPGEEIYIETDDYRVVAEAIKELKVRGAPAIGIAGAYGVALGALKIEAASPEEFRARLAEVISTIAGTRPTARNLFGALEYLQKAAQTGKSVAQIRNNIIAAAITIHEEEAAATHKLSEYGAELIQDGDTILTHCNTGPLATTGYGTALGVIIRAHEQGKIVKVFADETRPLLQGARLTCWEAQKAGIPVTLITDSMAGYFLNRGYINSVITGADRIAANGDTANKIGTYSLAVLAKENGVPFYIAAPTTTIDPCIVTGAQIPIEQRSPDEVTHVQGVSLAPAGVAAANPAFDVTPHKYITAIITEKGIIRKPYKAGIKSITSVA